MRKRFTRLLRLDHMFYAQEAPILISGGTLLRDEESGNLLCQITLHSLSEKEIRMVQRRGISSARRSFTAIRI